MGVKCGIDLGTTYSSISYFDNFNKDRVDTIDLNTLADGQRIARSVVYYPGPGQEVVVGEVAWNAKKQFPDRVVDAIKRSMGDKEYKKGPIDGNYFTPQQISADILKALIKDANAFLGDTVTDVVITVPAYFGDNERNATLEAGKLAGLNVLGLLPEPQAAALAYCLDKAHEIQDKYLLVYDLGGGTFDVTLLHATIPPHADKGLNLKFDMLYKAGLITCGGLDWDQALAELVCEKVTQKDGIDIRADAQNEAWLIDNCEKGKRYLSKASPVSILADTGQYQVEVTRSEFEDRTGGKVAETRALLEEVLTVAEKNYGVHREQIDVLLSGGSTRMPMIRQMIQEVMGKPPLEHGNPELLVTIGAAYWTYLMEGKPIVKGGQEINTNLTDGGDKPIHSVGVEVVRKNHEGQTVHCNAIVVPRMSKQGKQFEKLFYKVEDGMEEIQIILYKSYEDDAEAEDLSRCSQLGVFTIAGLPEGGKKGEPVKVTLGYDANGILCGEAVDVATGKKVDIQINRNKLI